MTILAPQWDFLYWQDVVFIANQGPVGDRVTDLCQACIGWRFSVRRVAMCQPQSGNGVSPARHQAITWTKADLLSIGSLSTNFSEVWINKFNTNGPTPQRTGSTQSEGHKQTPHCQICSHATKQQNTKHIQKLFYCKPNCTPTQYQTK